ncbi:MAG: hypothetical protein RhofKO_11820 [Rhodothermales bacterium]
MINTYSSHRDNVINSIVVTAETTYRYAIAKIFPLIDRFDAQRKLVDTRFYQRLERDIIKGCIMPPITIAFVNKQLGELREIDSITAYINSNIESGYILDGLQRMNTLVRANSKEDSALDLDRPLLLNIILAKNADMLLYRMITLNNGQKPMSPRHQIEILTKEIFKFDDFDISVQTEKERGEKIIRGAFNLGDIAKGYLAFLTNAVHNENKKIIEEKMDQILVGRIFDANTTDSDLEFEDVLHVIDRFSNDATAKKWLKTVNNLIGFCVGIRASFDDLNQMEAELFARLTEVFEDAFKSVNPSKVNLGKYRRELSSHWIARIAQYAGYDSNQLTEVFVDLTAV